MKKVIDIIVEVKYDKTSNPHDVLREWAKSIIEESTNYNWHEATWEEQQEQIREIMWKL